VNQGDLLVNRDGVHARKCQRAGRAGVRAPIVARKDRNGSGAKGVQEGGDVKSESMEEIPAAVPEEAKRAGEIRERWNWVEPTVWTDRMLTALEEGVKGGKWYSLMDKVYALANLRSAFKKVKDRGGAPGVDHQTIEMFEDHLEENLERLSQWLKEQEYRPQAIRRVWIPKGRGKEKRPLGIPTVRDRVVQTALLYVLEPIFEREFAEHSYGFRPHRGCKDALRRVDHLLRKGRLWVVDVDVRSYFDTIPHEPLMERVEERVADSRVLELLRAFLRQGVMETGNGWLPEEGTPQGAVISPLLANIYLNPLDHEINGRRGEMVRYADDFVLLCDSQAKAEGTLEQVRRWVEEAGLRLHLEKTRVVDATQPGGFDFLGYHFEQGKRWPRRRSLRRLKDLIRAKTKRANGNSLPMIILKVNRTLTGWFGYFKHSHRTTFPPLDGWIRMRLRSILRKRQHRKGCARGRDHQRWPNAFFTEQGLFSLVTAHAQACQSCER
jgi:RNA-directed DNA polymerase